MESSDVATDILSGDGVHPAIPVIQGVSVVCVNTLEAA
jgi:hypothetical protein